MESDLKEVLVWIMVTDAMCSSVELPVSTIREKLCMSVIFSGRQKECWRM